MVFNRTVVEHLDQRVTIYKNMYNEWDKPILFFYF